MVTCEIKGIVPVMLTPFSDRGAIDWESLERLTEWYLDNGAGALFAVCQSSEMQFLSLDERVQISRFVATRVGGRVPVLASGHIGATVEEQVDELTAISQTDVDCIVLVTNRLDPDNEGSSTFRENLKRLLSALPTDIPLGLYECPAPYRRLLSDDEMKLCRDSGRFVVLKDVSCSIETVKRRVSIVEGSGFAIINANAAIAFSAMRAGSPGFAGVFTNFHPDLYAWMYSHRNDKSALLRELSTFLALSATAENMGYPALAKLHHRNLGTLKSMFCRSLDASQITEKYWAVEAILDHIEQGTQLFRSRIS